MFQLLAGLLLPDAGTVRSLSGRTELWEQLRQEWQDRTLSWQVGPGRGQFQVGLWLHCSDGAAVPAELEMELRALAAGLPGVRLVPFPSLGLDVVAAMELSQLVLMINFEDRVRRCPTAQDRLWQLRLERDLPHQLSVDLVVDSELQRVQIRQRVPTLDCDDKVSPGGGHKGRQQLLPDTLNHWCNNGIPDQQETWDDQFQALRSSIGHRGLSAAGWQTRILCTWAEKRHRLWQSRQQRLLWGGVAGLILSSWLMVALLQPRTVLPMAAFYGLGAFLLFRRLRSLRLQALQWWCLASLFWVQDSWWRFAQSELPSRRLTTDGYGGEVSVQQGPLLQLLQAHQVDLLLQPQAGRWQNEDVMDVVRGLYDQEDLVGELKRRGMLRHRLMIGLVVALALLLLLVELRSQERMLRQLLLTTLLLLWAVWLGGETPLLSLNRMARHLRHLKADRHQLESWLDSAPEQAEGLRPMVESSLRRIGNELIDLTHDALEQLQWH